MPRYESFSRILALIALVILAITAFLCFESTETSTLHILGGLALGGAFMAGAMVA